MCAFVPCKCRCNIIQIYFLRSNSFSHQQNVLYFPLNLLLLATWQCFQCLQLKCYMNSTYCHRLYNYSTSILASQYLSQWEYHERLTLLNWYCFTVVNLGKASCLLKKWAETQASWLYTENQWFYQVFFLYNSRRIQLVTLASSF